jgi:NAD(P)-dependent dehydrogenase (short-subunit alcohol dehydrogenase family)
VIVNVSSSGALHPRPGFILYAAAKAGVHAMTEGLALAGEPTAPTSMSRTPEHRFPHRGPMLFSHARALNFVPKVDRAT